MLMGWRPANYRPPRPLNHLLSTSLNQWALSTRSSHTIGREAAVRITPELLHTRGMRVVIVRIAFQESWVYKVTEVPSRRLAWHSPDKETHCVAPRLAMRRSRQSPELG
jgi:hypothetical protein